MKTRTVAVIEVGTTRTVALVGRRSPESGLPETLAFSSHPTAGVRKGRVTNPEYVTDVVEKAVRKVEDVAGCSIADCSLVCSCGDATFTEVEGRVRVGGENGPGIVDEEDKARAIDACQEPQPPEGRIALDAFGQGWRLDDSPETVLEPIDREASFLSRRAIVPLLPERELDELESAVGASGLTVRHEILPAVAALRAATTEQLREDGVLCIDMGGGTTSWCLARHNRIQAVGALPVGGDHVTNDILAAFRPGSTAAAERLKTTHGCAVLEGVSRQERVPLSGDPGASGRTAPLYALAQVVNARMDETLRLVAADLNSRGLLHMLGAGVMLCGGASRLRGLPQLVARVFDAPSLRPSLSSDIEGFVREPDLYATIWGAFAMALDKDAQESARADRRSLVSRFANWFDREERR